MIRIDKREARREREKVRAREELRGRREEKMNY